MKTLLLKMIGCFCVLAVSLQISACNRNGNGDSSSVDPERSTEEITSEEMVNTDPSPVETLYYIQYTNVEFVSAEEKEQWREPLEKLLSNMKVMVVDREIQDVSFVAPDPAVPSVEYGYDVGLLDINFDGTPELLVNLGGGSSGNTFYYVYDIYTGECLGSLHGGGNDAWCVYFDTETGEYELIGQYQLRGGWATQMRYVRKATIGQAQYGEDRAVFDSVLFYTRTETEMYEIESGDSIVAYDGIYSVSYYCSEKGDCVPTDYYLAYDIFFESHIRLPETGLALVDISDVVADEDDRFAKAEKLTDALLSSSQQFLLTD